MRVGFDGMMVLVTGGSRGIGRAVAEQFAAQGATVAVQFRAARQAADDTVAALPGGGHLALQADLADPVQARSLAERVLGRLGRIDVLVNNAGIYREHPILATTYEEWGRIWRETIETNLIGPANLLHAVVPSMVAAGGGRIVNVSSRGAFRGEPDHPAYGASKAGLNSLGQSMARALGRHGIYVTTVAPGSSTPTWPPRSSRARPATASAPRARSTGPRPPRRSPAWSCSWPALEPST
jgi:3-oxoacyl-[acyl-carrier protein] reductase